MDPHTGTNTDLPNRGGFNCTPEEMKRYIEKRNMLSATSQPPPVAINSLQVHTSGDRECISVNGFIVRRRAPTVDRLDNQPPSISASASSSSISISSESAASELPGGFNRYAQPPPRVYQNETSTDDSTSESGSISDDSRTSTSLFNADQSYSTVPSRSSSITSLSSCGGPTARVAVTDVGRKAPFQAFSDKPMESVVRKMDSMVLDTSIVAPKKAPAERAGKKLVSLVSNVFPLEVQPRRIYRYDTTMKLVTHDGARAVDLHFKGNNNADISSRQRLCMFLLRRALEQYRILNDGQFFVHDGSAAVYCTENMTAALKPHGSSLQVAYADLPADVRELIHVPDAGKFVIDIKTCLDGAELNTAQYYGKQSNQDMGKLDRTFKQFFDLLTSYDAIKDGRFHIVRAGKMFDKTWERADLGCGHERARGLDKGIKFIEGSPTGKDQGVFPALVLDAKVGDFYKSQSLKKSVEQFAKHLRLPCCPFPFDKKKVRKEGEDKIMMNSTWSQVYGFVKGLRMKRIDRDNFRCSFVAAGITDIPVHQVMEDGIAPDSPKCPMMKRFAEQSRSIDQSLPAVIFKGFDPVTGMKTTIHYPMELLIVADGQSVPMDKMLVDPNRADKPHIRFEEIRRNLEALNLHNGGAHNELLAAFGVRISSRPLSVMGIERQKPKIGYNNRGQISFISADDVKGNWRMPMQGAYGIPAVISQLFLIGEESITDGVKQQLAMHCPKRGITADSIIELPFACKEEETYNTLDGLFQRIAAEGLPNQFVIFIDAKEKRTHHELKLLERKYEIRTMHITRHLAIQMRNQSATRDNIIHKLNEKAGGVNHFVMPDQYGKLWGDNTMYIGYDVQHPGAPSRDELMNKKPPVKPSVVGFSFNGGRDTSAFIGDFHYQNPRQEKVESGILNARMKWMLKLFREARGQLPTTIFVIRDGVSEGQYNMVMKEEFPALREGLEEYKNLNSDIADWSPKFVLIIVTKRHSVRLVTELRGGYHNPNPGTVVDDTIVRNDMTEFYLQAHRVLIGTGKFPSYQILIDEINASNDEVQSVMHALAYCHKIVDSPVSLPEPVYMADEWAKRGGNLFAAFGDRHKLPRAKTFDKEQYSEAPINFEILSKYLAYWNTRLEAFRVNA